MDTEDGISLLCLKHHVMLSHLHSIVLMSARHTLDDSTVDRTPPSEPFNTANWSIRRSRVGDLVDSMIEGRVTQSVGKQDKVSN
ncbi:hypothetical protein V8B97DRAFT_1559313 [Scleroderma yunnanense]